MEFQFTPRTFSPDHEGSSVIIERGTYVTSPGGNLTLDNSSFTSYDNCGKGMWEGVEVDGFSGSASFICQGKLYINNNSIIRNAYHGAAAVKWTDRIAENFDFAFTGLQQVQRCRILIFSFYLFLII